MTGCVRLGATLVAAVTAVACGGVREATSDGGGASSSTTSAGTSTTEGNAADSSATGTSAGSADGGSGTAAPGTDSTGVATGASSDSGGNGDGSTGSAGDSDCASETDIAACFALDGCAWDFGADSCQPSDGGDSGDGCNQIPLRFCRSNPDCEVDAGECTER